MQPIRTLTTRASLSATASFNARWFASLLAGSAILGAPALAVDNFWEGDTPPTSDWNTPGNWSQGRVPIRVNADTFDDAFVNIASPYPILTGDGAATARDIKVGIGSGSNGRLDIRAGTLSGQGWSVVGDDGGTGTLNVADASGSGGTFTAMGQGSGSYSPGFRLYVGGLDPGAAAGTLNVNTSGTIGMSELFVVGNGSGTGGTVNLDNGTINVGSETWIGQGSGGVGKLRMSGGTLNSNSWMAIAREGGQGTVEMTGGTWNQSGGSSTFIVGTGGLGEMTMSGGTVNVANITWVAETAGANGSKLTLNGAAVFNTPVMSVGPEGNGTLDLKGGTLRTGRITGKRVSNTGAGPNADSGVGTINFDGGQIVATAANSAFIADVNALNVAAGGMWIDSNGFNLGVPAVLDGDGGVMKSGAGTLSLEGANLFRGASSVSGGRLDVSTDSTGGGAYTVSAGGVLGARQTTETGVLQMSDLSVTDAGLAVTAVEFPDNPSAAPFRVNGTMTLSGQTALHLTDDEPVAGDFPMISYAAKAGSGTFVPGELPLGVTLDTGSPIVDSGSVISLNIARVNAPFWIGSSPDGSVWDTTTANWQDLYTGVPTTYQNGDPAVFEDWEVSPFTYDVTVGEVVSPGAGGVIFDNDLNDFFLHGSGTNRITGTTGLIKRGYGWLIIDDTLANDFTGPVRIDEGNISVGLLANAASASPLGKGDLVLAGGSLTYTGPEVSIDRGFQIDAPTNNTPSELLLGSNVTMSGPVTATSGRLRLAGDGVLTLSHPGTISLANGPQDAEPAAFVIDGGGLTLNGTNQIADVIGNTQIAVANGSTPALTLAGNAVLNVSRFQAGFGSGSDSTIVVQDNARLHKSAPGWLSIANSNNAIVTMTVRNAGSVVADGGDFNVGDTAASNGTLNVEDSGSVTSVGPVFIGKNGTTGAVNLSGQATMTSGKTEVAGGTDSQGSLTISGSSAYTSNNELLVGPGGGSTGVVTIEGSGTFQGNGFVSVGYNGGGTLTVRGDGSFANNDDFSVNENGDVPATVAVQDTGSLTVGGNLYIGRNGDRVGTLTVSGTGAEVNQTNAAMSFNVGQSGTGTLNIQGSAMVTAASNNGVVLGQVDNGTGTVNLDGGTLTAKRIFGNAGASTFRFGGGLLRAGAGANPAFFSGVDNPLVNAGGARIDSNGQNISVGQPLLAGTTAGGGLTKSGTGTLRLTGVNTYTGATTVTAGNLGGSTTIAGPLVVQAGAGLAPGAVTGTLTASGGVTFDSGSTLIVNIDSTQAATHGRLDATGTVNVNGVNLQVNVVNGTATPYTIVTAGTVTGTFASVTPGTSVSYNGNNITITPPSATPFQTWIGNFDVNGETGPGADPDDDGLTNLEEFALDGDPSSGTSTGKVRSRIATVGGQRALVITLPVRTGATFDNNPGPGLDATVAADGVTYLIQGSNNLVNFDQGVTEIAAETDMPELSDETKWSYRTFRLDGEIPARGARGFLRVVVQAP